MNERYLFRGKSPENYENGGQWLTGYLQQYRLNWLGEPCHGSQPEEKQWFAKIAPLKNGVSANVALVDNYFEVDPATVGQCTGLRDKNGVLIFEGDVILFRGTEIAEIVWASFDYLLAWYIEFGECRLLIQPDYSACIEVIGNIYDNPELVGEVTNRI